MTGIAPADPRAEAVPEQTSYCWHCAELIRYWPAIFTWRHVVARPHDHEPLPMPESELRLMDGNR